MCLDPSIILLLILPSPLPGRLEFGTTPSSEPGAPPIVTNDIMAMISPEREKVPLLKVRMWRGGRGGRDKGRGMREEGRGRGKGKGKVEGGGEKGRGKGGRVDHERSEERGYREVKEEGKD